MDSSSALSLFLGTSVGDHIPRATTGDVYARKCGPVLVVQREESLPRAFRKLATENFLSAPVLDGNRYVGFIDLMDLVKKTTDMFWGDSVEAWTTFWDKEDKFQNATVDDLMAVPNEWTRDPYPPLKSDFSTLYALEMMVRTNQHRVAVISKKKRVTGILTQSMLISWLRQERKAISPLLDIRVSDMIGEHKQQCNTINENEIAMNAFKQMANKKVHGLAVVDDTGILTGAISVRDLRGVGESGEFFQRLFKPINTFKELVRSEHPRLAPRTHYSNKKVPRRGLFVTPDQTFEDVLNQMSDGNIHRVFVCDNANNPRPNYTISQVDVLRVVLNHMIKDAERARV